MFNNIPTLSKLTINEEPPELKKGRVIPVTGIEEVTTPKLRMACKTSWAVIPVANIFPNKSLADIATLNPRHAKKKNNTITVTVPNKPSS